MISWFKFVGIDVCRLFSSPILDLKYRCRAGKCKCGFKKLNYFQISQRQENTSVAHDKKNWSQTEKYICRLWSCFEILFKYSYSKQGNMSSLKHLISFTKYSPWFDNEIFKEIENEYLDNMESPISRSMLEYLLSLTRTMYKVQRKFLNNKIII